MKTKPFILLLSLQILQVHAECKHYRDGYVKCAVNLDGLFNPSEEFFDESKFLFEYSSGTITKNTFSKLKEIESLDITNSEITSVENGALCSMPKLKTLSLSSFTNIIDYRKVQFPNVTKNMLKGCDKLIDFEIDKVTFDEDIFESLPNVETLRISRTKTKITKKIMDKLQNLKEIRITNSEITSVEPGALCSSPHMKVIRIKNFSSFPKVTYDMLSNCNNVEVFYMRMEELSVHYTEIEPQSFRSMGKLRELTLLYIPIIRLTKDFLKGLYSLEELYIWEGEIAKVTADAFEDTKKLKSIFFYKPGFKKFLPGTLDNLKKLEKIECFYGKPKTIENIPILPNLKVLNIGEDLIEEYREKYNIST